MPHSPFHRLGRFAAPLFAAALLLVPQPARAAWPTDPNTLGLPLRTGATGDLLTTYSRAVSDGSGGMIVVWVDARNFVSTNYDLYAQRVSANGTVMWSASGVPVTTAVGAQGYDNVFDLALVPDGLGGVTAAWTDNRTGGNDIYAQHLDANGNRTWGASDVALCTATGVQQRISATDDGLGGIIAVWTDYRNGNPDIYARRVLANGTLSWTTNGVAVCTEGSSQGAAALVPGTLGGATIVWSDGRTPMGPYAQRLTTTGSPLWTTNGVFAGSGSPTSMTTPMVAGDGSGAVFIGWGQGGAYLDVYLSHLNSSGSADQVQLVCDATSHQYPIDLKRASDGSYLIAWSDFRGATSEYYAQRFSPGGYPYWTDGGVAITSSGQPYDKDYVSNIEPTDDGGFLFSFGFTLLPEVFAQRVNANGSRRWGSGGIPVCVAAGRQVPGNCVGDGANGLLVHYIDQSGNPDAPYAAHLDANGQMLDARPTITRVKDVLNDQGGKLLLEWSASALEGDAAMPISQYQIWRKVPIASVAALASRAAFDDDGLASVGDRTIRRTGSALLPTYWEFVQSQTALSRPGYAITVSTTSDSTPTANPRTWYMVSAQKSDGTYWDSAPDSGYSVDNLPPGAPAPFSGAYANGATQLLWGANQEADLAGYRVYRGATANFGADPAHLVSATSQPGYNDAFGAPAYYKVTAVDIHGNESPVASLMPSGTLDAPGGAHAALALAAPSPNPLRAGERSALRFALPAAAHARVTLVDAQGRAAATLADRAFEAGEHSLAFAAHDARGGALSPGLYFVVLETRGERLTRRLVLLR